MVGVKVRVTTDAVGECVVGADLAWQGHPAVCVFEFVRGWRGRGGEGSCAPVEEDKSWENGESVVTHCRRVGRGDARR